MTSRRIVSEGKDPLEGRDLVDTSPGSSERSNIAPAVSMSVILKLLGFTAAMIAGPIGVYFLSVNIVFHGNATLAGAAAAFTANLVLIAYIIVAMKEDQSDKIAAQETVRKTQ
ncbi:MAG: hypothetical protein LQ342_005562 [Letrouitia transgressa]|nr:MAG: hypothetical protein LQ342_005562 [Letrouitia transgressa]